MWSKPAPSKDWPMRESIYDQGIKMGRLWIRKQTFEKVERGITHFTARGYLLVKHVAPGLVDIGGEQTVAPMTLTAGTPFLGLKVEFSSDDYWMWLCDRAYDALKCKTYPRCIWVA